MQRKIDFFIIGAPKCGTTSLFDYLRQHPEVFLPQAKENRFFVEDEYYEQGEQFLNSFYKGLRSERVVGGALTELMHCHYAAERLYKYNSQFKLIAMLRNPIDRAYSEYWFARRNGWERCKTFEEALEKEPARRNGNYVEKASLAYLAHGHYYEQLDRYLQIFGRSNLFVILTEDLNSRADEVVRSILMWLGVEPDCSTINLAKRSNEAGMPRSMWLQRTLMSYDARYKRFAKKITTPEMRYILNRLIERLLRKNLQPFTYPPMQPATRVRLVDYFAPHNRKLSQLIGRDLSHWQ